MTGSTSLFLAFVLGVATGLTPAAAALVPLGLRTSRSSRGRVLCALCFLAGLAWEVRDRPRTGTPAGFPAGRAVEGHVEGKVLELPGPPTPDGTRLAIDAPQGTILLRVHGTTPPVLDDRLPGDRVRVWARVRAARGLGQRWTDVAPLDRRAARYDLHGEVKSPLLLEARPGHGARAAPGRLLARAKRALRRRIASVWPPGTGTTAALASSMLLGDRDRLDERLRAAFEACGISHLVAISGLHVSAVALLASSAAGRVGLRGRGRLVSSTATVVAYAMMVGPRASVLRAALGFILVATGRALGRDAPPAHSVAVVAAALAVADPAALAAPGIQLSLLAAWALVSERKAFASVATYAVTAPVLAYHFGSVSPAGILVNVVAVPLAGLFVPAAAVALAAADVPALGPAAAAVAEGLGEGIAGIALTLREAGVRERVVTRPSRGFLLLFAAALAGKRSPRARLLLAGMLWSLHVGPFPSVRGEPEVDAFDVGQGLAVAVAAGGRRLLFDAGGFARSRYDPGARVVVPGLLEGGGRLDVLAVSHEHADHAGGAAAVLRRLRVSELWLPAGFSAAPRLLALADLAREKGSAVRTVGAGGSARIGRLTVRALAPSPRGARALSGNDRSLVLHVSHPDATVLLPGDLEARGERTLVAREGPGLAADLLVVGHHGSKSGTLDEWLDAVHPRRALVSAGYRNRFGHPHREVVERLERRGVAVFRTDLHGRIRFRFAPPSVSCYRRPTTVNGDGMKQSAKITARTSATALRPAVSGSPSSHRRGWRSRIHNRIANHRR